MYIEELKEEKELGRREEEEAYYNYGAEEVGGIIVVKRVLVGAGARTLFYPTLLYNVVRNKIQADFRWWDWIGEYVLLGAVPFPTDVERLKDLGVCGVITLNEPYETLVPTSLYKAYGINHLVLPTRDYLFAPSLTDICQAVDFIHENASRGQSTYVHCKAGRGRSTTIVLCYLVQYKQMTPEAAYNYVKSIRPRVRLASAQWQAVQEYYRLKVKFAHDMDLLTSLLWGSRSSFAARRDVVKFDDGSVVVVTKEDLEGYDPSQEVSGAVSNKMWKDVSLVYRVQVAGQTALAGLSYLWVHCHAAHPKSSAKLKDDDVNSEMVKDEIGVLSVGIHVY